MTGFDIVVMVVVGLGASRGFLRGFVQEVMELAAWLLSLVCIHVFLGPLATFLEPHVHSSSGASVLAFLLLGLVPYGAARLLAGYMGSASRNSVLGPIDRVLGFGFGAVKGSLIIVLGFSVIVLAYDTVWGAGGRPVWLTKSRTYPFVNASSDALIKAIGKRREEAAAAAATATETPTPEETPTPRHHHKRPAA